MLVQCVMIVLTLTMTCTDDRLAWSPAPDADLAYYLVYRGGVPVGQTELTHHRVECDEAVYYVVAVDLGGLESEGYAEHQWAADPGRLMEWREPCDLACSRCVAWDGAACVERERIPGTVCCTLDGCGEV